MDDLLGERTRDKINDLDCIECGRWFPTFDRLARHMAARHGRPTPNEPGDVELPPKNNPVRKHRPMAKAKTAPKRKAGGGIPAPSANAENSEFNAFLKASDIGKVGATASLLLTGETRVVDGNFGEQIVNEVKLGRTVYDWAITIDSVNHRMLFDRFGKDPKKWRGKVAVEVKMSRQNREYIACQRER